MKHQTKQNHERIRKLQEYLIPEAIKALERYQRTTYAPHYQLHLDELQQELKERLADNLTQMCLEGRVNTTIWKT